MRAVRLASVAADGTYAIAGGSPAEQAQVHAALRGSSFDWSVVPPVTVRIVRDGLEHGQLTCERFASTVAWSYWPVPGQRPAP